MDQRSAPTLIANHVTWTDRSYTRLVFLWDGCRCMSVILFTTKSIVSTRSLSCEFALQEFVFSSVWLRGYFSTETWEWAEIFLCFLFCRFALIFVSQIAWADCVCRQLCWIMCICFWSCLTLVETQFCIEMPFCSEPYGNKELFVDPVGKAILEGEKLSDLSLLQVELSVFLNW